MAFNLNFSQFSYKVPFPLLYPNYDIFLLKTIDSKLWLVNVSGDSKRYFSAKKIQIKENGKTKVEKRFEFDSVEWLCQCPKCRYMVRYTAKYIEFRIGNFNRIVCLIPSQIKYNNYRYTYYSCDLDGSLRAFNRAIKKHLIIYQKRGKL